MANTPTIERRNKEAEAAFRDPIMREPVVLWMAEKVAGIDPYEAAPHIRSSLDKIAGAESSGGWNTTGVKNKKTGNRALGNYQWFPVPFKEDLEALDTYLRKSAGIDRKDWKTPAWITEAIEHRDPRKLSDHRQDLVQMARVTRLADNDDIAKMWMGDIPALRDFYAIKHHTQGYEDEATLEQMDKWMPLPEGYVSKEPTAKEPEPEQYADLNNPEKEPSIPAQQLGNLNIEDYNPEPSIAAQSLDLPTVDFEEANRQGMLSSLGVDVPKRDRVVVPQPSLAGTEFDFIRRREQEKERQGMMASLGIDMPTRQRAPSELLREQQVTAQRVPSELLREQQVTARRVPSELLREQQVTARRVPSELLQEQKVTARRVPSELLREQQVAARRVPSELLQEQQVTARRVPSELLQERQVTAQRVPAELLQEIVPTQRGQVPIPQPLPVEPERVVGSEPRLESELASEMLKPLPPELEELDLSTIPKSVAESYERVETPAVVEDRRAAARSRIPAPPTQDELRDQAKSRIPDIGGVSTDPDPRTGDERKFDRNRDTILTGATLGAYDEAAGFLNSAFTGTPYAETVGQIRKNVSEQRLMNPTTALFQEAIPGLITGGGLAGQLVKRGVGLATAGGAEGAFTGAMYGETPAERAGMAVLLGTAGGTIGGAIGWATTRSSKATASIDGARTPSDNLADDELLTITIDQAIKAGNTVKYRTNGGTLKTVEVQQVLDNGNVQIKDGTNVYAVPKAKIERVNVGKTFEGAIREAEEIGQFIDVNRHSIQDQQSKTHVSMYTSKMNMLIY